MYVYPYIRRSYDLQGGHGIQPLTRPTLDRGLLRQVSRAGESPDGPAALSAYKGAHRLADAISITRNSLFKQKRHGSGYPEVPLMGLPTKE
jgi:hypothetical protein